MTSQPLKSLPVFVCAASWTAVTSPWLRRWRQRSSPSNQSSAASATTKEPKSCWRIWTSRDFFFYSKWTGGVERTTSCAADRNVLRKWTQPGTLMRHFSPWWKNISVWRTKWCCEKTGSTRRCPLCVGVHLKVCTTHEQNTKCKSPNASVVLIASVKSFFLFKHKFSVLSSHFYFHFLQSLLRRCQWP